MNDSIVLVLALIKSALDGTPIKEAKNVDYAKIYAIGKEYQLLPLICAGMAVSNLQFPDEIQQKADKKVLENFVYDSIQQSVLSEMLSLLESGGFAHMPVKGILLKKMYPSSELRPMGDGDILIRRNEYEKVAALIAQHGFVFRCESAHEYIYNKNGICIELHKHLIPPYNRDYYGYYGDGWKLAEKESGKRYKMKDNDHYIYLFTHFSKHYRDGGVGPIHLVDLWVFAQHAKLDFDYILAELEKLQLVEFHKNIMLTLGVWFAGKTANEITDFITNRVFENGNFGTIKSRAIASATKTSKSSSARGIAFKKGIRVLFPTAAEMQYRYPILKKHAFLTPFFWAHRFFSTLLFKRRRLKVRVQEAKYTTSENVKDYHGELNYVGLDFNFKE